MSRAQIGIAGGVVAAICGLVAHFEGLRTTAYRDPVGIWTICEGITQGVKPGDTATMAECKAMTRAEVERHLADVDRCTPGLPDPIRAAMGDLAYNVGGEKYCASRIAAHLKAGRYKQGCDELLKWVYAGGTVLPGLVKRRQAEHALCMQGAPHV